LESQLHGTVLITGATGFIGSHLCRRLANNQRVALHAISRSEQEGSKGIRWWKADLAASTAVRSVFAEVKPDFVFHLASVVTGARDISFVRPTLEANFLSTVNIMIGAAESGCRRVVLAGSMEEPAGAADPVPCSPYAAAKFASTAYARMFHALYSLPVVVLRVFMTYGPAQKDLRKLIPYVILSLLRGEAPQTSTGTRLVDWIYVEDVVDGILRAATAPGVEGKVADIGSGTLVPIRAIVEKLVQLVCPEIVPHFGEVPDRPLEQVRVADVAQSFQEIGWRPAVSLDEGLRRTVEWYRIHSTSSQVSHQLTTAQTDGK